MADEESTIVEQVLQVDNVSEVAQVDTLSDVVQVDTVSDVVQVDVVSEVRNVTGVGTIGSVGPIESIKTIENNNVTLAGGTSISISGMGGISNIDNINKIENSILTRQVYSPEEFVTQVALQMYVVQDFGDFKTEADGVYIDKALYNPDNIAQRCIHRAQVFWSRLPESYKEKIIKETKS